MSTEQNKAAARRITEETWNKVLNTNLKAAWAMTKACVPSMKKQERGAIVLVSSSLNGSFSGT